MDDDRGAIFIEDGVETGFESEIACSDLDVSQTVRGGHEVAEVSDVMLVGIGVAVWLGNKNQKENPH